ncbi:hypothetical protein [Aeromonas veronii]|uniref:hypothetical protein n=1 Tax=Aeromonas veronii TaxID=654 RepID=UPI002B4931F7|nr:hypothetical protein [Aeromonas veronii]
MRLGWLLLLFPSAAFAIAGCPVGVQLGNVTMATPLPVCLKFEGSQLGGCLVDCNGVCVELPLANTKGPVETTGNACNWTENGSGNGDSDGSGNTPGEGGNSGNGGLPKNWDFFNPVIGDATGTSVSATIAKLNKNLGKHIGAFSENTDKIYQRVNELTGDSRRIVNATERAKDLLQQMTDFQRTANSKLEGIELFASRSENYLQQIAMKAGDSGSGSGSGGTSGGDNSKIHGELKQFHQDMFGPDFAENNIGGTMYGLLSGYSYDISSIKENISTLDSNFNNFYWNTAQELRNNSIEMNRNLRTITEAIKNGGIGTGGGEGGAGIDYSKLPGSGDNPLAVKEGKYSSACSGNDCFFDVAAIQKKLDEANKAISDKYKDIGDEVRDIFDFQLSGSAGVIECFDFFTYGGKDYRVCPPAKEYWNIIAALMMFIFYFIAFAIVFKR